MYIPPSLMDWSMWSYLQATAVLIVVLHMVDANLPAFGKIKDVSVLCIDVFILYVQCLLQNAFCLIFMPIKLMRSIVRNTSYTNLLHYMTHMCCLLIYSTSSHPNSMYLPLKYQLADMTWYDLKWMVHVTHCKNCIDIQSMQSESPCLTDMLKGNGYLRSWFFLQWLGWFSIYSNKHQHALYSGWI